MAYYVTREGEVYEPSILGQPGWRVPGWRYATLYYSARNQKRHTYGGSSGVPIWDEANFAKLEANISGSPYEVLDAAITRADANYAKSGGLLAPALTDAGKAFVASEAIPLPLGPALTPEVLPAKKKRKKKKKNATWIAPVAVGGGILLLVSLLIFARRGR